MQKFLDSNEFCSSTKKMWEFYNLKLKDYTISADEEHRLH